MVNKEKIVEIKDAALIEDVVSEYVRLRPKGGSLVGLCPFHDDTNPSLNVSPATQRYKCFVCNEGGDVIDFIKEVEGYDFIQAIEWLAEFTGIDVGGKKSAYDELEEEARRYRENYTTVDEHERLFEVGFAKSGFFAGRRIYPIKNMRGRVVGFGGRGEDPKYLNSPSSQVYDKSRTLYGFFEGRKDIARTRKVYVVEGYTDVINFHRLGTKNVVATCGTAFTDQQAQILSTFVDKVIFAYDGDDAGHRGTMSGIKTCIKNGLLVDVLVIPEGSDPGDLKVPPTKLRQLNFVDWVRDSVEGEERIRVNKQIRDMLRPATKDYRDYYEAIVNGEEPDMKQDIAKIPSYEAQLIHYFFKYGEPVAEFVEKYMTEEHFSNPETYKAIIELRYDQLYDSLVSGDDYNLCRVLSIIKRMVSITINRKIEELKHEQELSKIQELITKRKTIEVDLETEKARL